MLAKNWMMATGSVLVLGAMLAPSVMAQTADDTIETIVVTGIRGSLEKSAAIKRDSKQIVDVITAEDVGKLPDNNVVEALAHVTGVQIYRTHGEGSGLAIRGMTDVQTTLNGNDTSTGTARSMNLSDVPAELLKSVTVYKTRTADQVEGGIAGSVNVDLRRPLDLPEGWTVAGSLRGVNSSIGNTWSPYGSLLAAYRTDTSIGEVGFLVNFSYTQNNYFENFIESETPDHFSGTDLTSLPSSQQNIFSPYAVNYGIEQGTTTRPSISVSTQWKPTENLDFVLEGSFFSSKDQLHRDRLHMIVRNGTYNLSNVTLMNDSATVKSLTETSASGGTVNGGPETYLTTTNSSTGSLNFETHWHDGRWQVNFGSQYNWSASKYYLLGLYTRFPDATSVNVDFDSDMVKGGGPYVEYNNVDMKDLSEYTIMQLHDEVGHNRSKQWSGQIDGAYHVSDVWYVRDFTFGVRATGRRNSYDYGYRDWTFNDTSGTSQYIPASSFPVCSDSYNLISPDVSGVNSPSWYRISASCVKKNFAAVRQGIIAELGKGTAAANRWETSQPLNTDLAQSYSDHEYTFGGYAQMTLGATLFGMPVDGLAGVRVVNTWGDSSTVATTL
ncbi:MAG: TonB-dependent receptor plug domain-containing protein, partial [Rhizomicrobium sp.]